MAIARRIVSQPRHRHRKENHAPTHRAARVPAHRETDVAAINGEKCHGETIQCLSEGKDLNEQLTSGGYEPISREAPKKYSLYDSRPRGWLLCIAEVHIAWPEKCFSPEMVGGMGGDCTERRMA
jgi:hypothetical protein